MDLEGIEFSLHEVKTQMIELEREVDHFNKNQGRKSGTDQYRKDLEGRDRDLRAEKARLETLKKEAVKAQKEKRKRMQKKAKTAAKTEKERKEEEDDDEEEEKAEKAKKKEKK